MSVGIALALLSAIYSSLNPAIAQNRQGYYPGDWVTYTNTRFITSIDVSYSDVYIGTTGGIIRYNGLERRWMDPITESDGLPSHEIWLIAFDRYNDEIWVETPLGYYSYSSVFQRWSPENSFPRDLKNADISGRINFQTYTPLLGYQFYSEGGVPQLIDENLREYRITEAVEDDYSSMWVGTFGHGLLKFDQSSGFMEQKPFGPYQDYIEDIYFDGDTVWFGGFPVSEYANAITMWDRRSDEWRYFEARFNDRIVSDNVYDITADETNVYFATDQGLVVYEKDSERFFSFTRTLGLRSQELYSLHVEDSLLFMGGDGTVDVMLVPRDSIFSLSVPPQRVTRVDDIDRIGDNFWLCTTRGVVQYNEKTREWSDFDTRDHNLSGEVWQVFEADDGHVWFAGIDGVVHLDSDLNEIETFLSRHDLDNSVPHRVALIGDRLWIGTDNGVMRYDRVTRLWEDYGEIDGLIDDYVNDMKVDGDYIWFATPEGATRFYWNNPLSIRR